MSLGLKEVLGVNLSFISKKNKKVSQLTIEEFPLVSDMDDIEAIVERIKDDDNSTETETIKEPIKDIKFEAREYPKFFSSEDFLDWDIKEQYIVKMVDAQILKSLDETINITQDVLDDFSKNLSTYLSFEAQLVRSEIIAWALGRMAGDFQAQIDADNGYLDQWDTGFDLALQCLTATNNMLNNSSSKRSLFKIGGRHVLMSEASNEDNNDESGIYEFINPKNRDGQSINFNYARYSISALSSAVNELMDELSYESTTTFQEELYKQGSATDDAEKLVQFLDIILREKFDLNFRKYDEYDNKDYSYSKFGLLNNKIGNINNVFNIINNRSFDSNSILEYVSNNNGKIQIRINLPYIFTKILNKSVLGEFEEIEINTISAFNDKDKEFFYQSIISEVYPLVNSVLNANPTWTEWFTSNWDSVISDFIECAKLFTQFRRSQLFYKNDSIKGDFERAADCYGAIPSVLEHSLAYIKSGHYFDNDTNFIKDITTTTE